MTDPEAFVIVHQATTPAEAEVVLVLLKSGGFRARIPDHQTPLPGIDITPFGSLGGVGCDVCVPAGELEEAKSAIESARAEGGGAEEEGDESE